MLTIVESSTTMSCATPTSASTAQRLGSAAGDAAAGIIREYKAAGGGSDRLAGNSDYDHGDRHTAVAAGEVRGDDLGTALGRRDLVDHCGAAHERQADAGTAGGGAEQEDGERFAQEPGLDEPQPEDQDGQPGAQRRPRRDPSQRDLHGRGNRERDAPGDGVVVLVQ